MSILIGYVILYLCATVAVGIRTATRVKHGSDDLLAKRSLPLYMVMITVFATWFGASMCLILVGLFLARKLCPMRLPTTGAYYGQRYNRAVELLVSLCIVVAYLGWLCAQISALGLVFNLLSLGTISLSNGMMIGAAIVVLYALFGQRWSVAFTDLFQMVIIVAGLLYLAYIVTDLVGGSASVIEHVAVASKLDFAPTFTATTLLAYVAAWVTMLFGSIPPQHVFQCENSAKDETTARGALIPGVRPFVLALTPFFLAYTVSLIVPQGATSLLVQDAQRSLPALLLDTTPLFAQGMFFGALLAAIMSTASGALLAPSIMMMQNVLRPLIPMRDSQLRLATRIVVVLFSIAVTALALALQGTSIYDMVGNAYKVTLVGAFIPLVMGLYWSRATSQGALFAVVFGLTAWLQTERLAEQTVWPPQLVGLLVSFLAMVIGSLIPQVVCRPASAFR